MRFQKLDGLRPGTVLAVAAVAVAGIDICFGWPGTLTPDSQDQLRQVLTGTYTDWHPPLMARMWALFEGALPAMLCLQVALHWFGFWAFAEAVRRERPRFWVWIMLAIGASPIALKYTGVIQKDTLLASLFVCSFGIAALSGGAKIPAFLGVAGTLMRANGVFALPPLLLLRFERTRFVPATVICLIIAAALIPIASLVNHDLLGAKRTGVERSLQIFDLAGIAYYSGDTAVLPEAAKDADHCYTPLFWDALNAPGCAGPFDHLPASLTRDWVSGIIKHPIAYAHHRIAHFNKTIFFLVPPMEQCFDAPSRHRCDFTKRGFVEDFVTKNALLWPVTWLLVGSILLFGHLHPVSHALVLSGILYGSAYLVVGVASDFRYFYWSEIAVQAAIVFHLGNGRKLLHCKQLIIAVVVVWALGYWTRYVMY